MAFQLQPLPYSNDALEPHIDAKTMEIHHDKHHAAYTNNLNNAIAGTEWGNKTIEEILANVSLNLSKPPNCEFIASIRSPVGMPPAFGAIISQNKLWL